MAVRITKGASTDGVSREFYASQCRDSSKLSGPGNGDHWWGVRNDCNGFFSIHHGLEEALAEAAEYDASVEVYVVPVVVFVDTDCLRLTGARIRAKGMGTHLPI